MDKQYKAVTSESYSKLIFTNYRIERINFRVNPDFKFEKPIKVNFSLDSCIQMKEQSDEKNANEAIITIDCIIFENAIENDYPFTLEITIVGNFEVEGEIEHEDFMRFCELNGTAVLFVLHCKKEKRFAE